LIFFCILNYYAKKMITFCDIPYDVKRYEIIPKLDSVSLMVLRNVLLGKPYKKLSDDEQKLVISYGLEFTKHFWDLLDKHNVCYYAASCGSLEVLQWAHANECPWNALTCFYAAEAGHLNVLQWARINGCPWDNSTYLVAIMNNREELIKWALANGCPMPHNFYYS